MTEGNGKREEGVSREADMKMDLTGKGTLLSRSHHSPNEPLIRGREVKGWWRDFYLGDKALRSKMCHSLWLAHFTCVEVCILS